MNKKIFSIVTLASAAALGVVCIAANKSHFQPVANTGIRLIDLFETPAFAVTPPPASTDSCFKTFREAVAAAPKRGDWTNAVLDHFHAELYRFNKIETADVELIFCRLAKVMGGDPNLSSLPQTVTKTDPMGGTMVVTVTSPTESFATTNGYTAKAELAYNDTTFMTLWWAGNGSASKGYLIQGANPMQTDGETRLRYLQWDRTTDDQSVKILATQFETSYLGSASGATTSVTGGDQAIFARLTYNASTQAISGQDVEIREGRGLTTLKCIRTYFTGTLGGTIAGYRPAQGTPEDVTETSTGGSSAGSGGGMDGETGLTDSKTTADHSGTASPGSALASGTFDYSCNDLNSAGTTGVTFSPFASNTVDFTLAPSTVFPK